MWYVSALFTLVVVRVAVIRFTPGTKKKLERERKKQIKTEKQINMRESMRLR